MEVAEQNETATDLSNADIVEATYLNPATEDCTFISLSDLTGDLGDDYYVQDALSISTEYPTGIVVPVIYANSGMGALSSTESLEQIQTECTAMGKRMVIATEGLSMYGTLYGSDVNSFCIGNAKEAFLAREAFVYMGTSADYFDIQESMPGEYSVMFPDCGISVYQYGMVWSIVDGEKTDEEAAEGFLSYLTSDFAQEYLFVQSKSDFLPISKTVMDVYLSVYSELEGLSEYLELPFSAPQSDLA